MIQNIIGARGGDIDDIIDDSSKWAPLGIIANDSIGRIVEPLKYLKTEKRIYLKGKVTGQSSIEYDYNKFPFLGDKQLPLYVSGVNQSAGYIYFRNYAHTYTNGNFVVDSSGIGVISGWIDL